MRRKAKTPEDIQKPTFLTAQSEAVRNDTFNWNYTLNTSIFQKTGNTAGFILSSGDQIQTNAEEGRGRNRQRDGVCRILKPGYHEELFR